MISATTALERLREGNRRALSGVHTPKSVLDPLRYQALASGQEPFAVILGCSDSRVPPEIIFDQSPGDLFVIRVAGNIAAPSQVGSIEFAVENFGTTLVVVLGHSNCGAILATLESLNRPASPASANLQTIVDYVRPSIEPLLKEVEGADAETLVDGAVRANIRAAAANITTLSPRLAARVKTGDLRIVGAEYSLQTGQVDFFHGVDGM